MIVKKGLLSNILFYIAYCLFFVSSILVSSFYGIYVVKVYNYIIVLCIILLFINEMIKKTIILKEFIMLVLSLFLTILLMRHNESIFLLPFFFFIYAARNVDFKNIAKTTIIMSLFLLLFVYLVKE